MKAWVRSGQLEPVEPRCVLTVAGARETALNSAFFGPGNGPRCCVEKTSQGLREIMGKKMSMAGAAFRAFDLSLTWRLKTIERLSSFWEIALPACHSYSILPVKLCACQLLSPHAVCTLERALQRLLQRILHKCPLQVCSLRISGRALARKSCASLLRTAHMNLAILKESGTNSFTGSNIEFFGSSGSTNPLKRATEIFPRDLATCTPQDLMHCRSAEICPLKGCSPHRDLAEFKGSCRALVQVLRQDAYRAPESCATPVFGVCLQDNIKIS